MFKLALLFCLVAVATGGSIRSLRPRLDGRIVGGTATTIENHPYQVSLQYYGSHLCGGSIISSNYVLTAAHCCILGSASRYSIRAGTTTRDSGGVVYSVARVLRHPKYDSRNIDYDYALMQISGSFALGSSQAVVALPEEGEAVAEGTPAVVTGWGILEEGGSSSPTILQEATVRIVDPWACNTYYGGSITQSMLCAGIEGAGGKGSCEGDSGGPLVVENKLVGVVSWARGCARPNYPGVFARVATARAWIKENAGV